MNTHIHTHTDSYFSANNPVICVTVSNIITTGFDDIYVICCYLQCAIRSTDALLCMCVCVCFVQQQLSTFNEHRKSHWIINERFLFFLFFFCPSLHQVFCPLKTNMNLIELANAHNPINNITTSYALIEPTILFCLFFFFSLLLNMNRIWLLTFSGSIN